VIVDARPPGRAARSSVARRRPGAAPLAAVLILAVVAGCRRDDTAPVSVRRTRIIMGTQVTVTVFASTQAVASRAAEAAFARMTTVERLMSTHDPDSELSCVNAGADEAPVAVSHEIFEVVARAGEYCRMSDGAFDVTVMPLVKLWTSASEAGRPPSAEALRDTLTLVGYDKLTLDAGRREIGFSRHGMGLALGGIAKGYAVDLAVESLRAHGVTSAVVDAGGDIRVLGRHPTGRAWLVGVRNPFEPDGKPLETLRLAESAVATSGDYERFYTIEGRRYSHIFDPRNGLAVENAHSVTVIAADATAADALATTISVLGAVEGIRLVEELPGTECLFVSGSTDAPLVRTSSGFARFLSGEDG